VDFARLLFCIQQRADDFWLHSYEECFAGIYIKIDRITGEMDGLAEFSANVANWSDQFGSLINYSIN
jgi:hypothetical protein